MKHFLERKGMQTQAHTISTDTHNRVCLYISTLWPSMHSFVCLVPESQRRRVPSPCTNTPQNAAARLPNDHLTAIPFGYLMDRAPLAAGHTTQNNQHNALRSCGGNRPTTATQIRTILPFATTPLKRPGVFFLLLHCFGHHSRHLAPSHDRAAPMPTKAQPAASYSCSPSPSSYRHASETDPRPSRRCSQRHSCPLRSAPTPCCIVARSRPSSSHAQGSQTNGRRTSVHRLGSAAASWPPSTRRCCSQPQATGEDADALAGASRHPSSGAARHPGIS
ncbi:hypothetical protein TCSYLVIO_004042 [Trypanosoma cruzi]|nr:hypothetical protein TCSYLVIO_004042 [Trypanosoma cruzi]